ncbi:MAG: VWA domain-containing protein [Chloroflexi bacterium]|nr:VWA domain-containing protein [Chloroflexota bacterium]MCI0578911.1 VWA domain-containing protein [Chloroflexota bacterium]MCI0647538.1 VWA domain-containing protein [Chloroflexota bacterium]MCI0730849.1 VWA domain-containing protein [Chloroflexota bacterium]
MEFNDVAQRRQVVYWRLLAAVFGFGEQAANFEEMALELVHELELPELLLHPTIAVDTLLERYPELEPDFRQVAPGAAAGQPVEGEGEPAGPGPDSLRRGLVYSKLLLNVLGPNTQTSVVTAQQYSQWLKDVAHLERACGLAPGGLRGQEGGDRGSLGAGEQGSGGGIFVAEEQLRAALASMEGDLIQRMALREVLQNNQLAAQLTPSMPLVEQLLRDKANLSGTALANAKRLIRQYVDELTEVLKLQVQQTPAGKIDYTVPPKRVFRNLDLKRTIWKNLTNWDAGQQRLYVDRLYYHHTARKKTPARLIVVVDQSGSMVDAMVQCTILASIFAAVPHVDVYLLAFDTRVLDLTPWVHDPFEVLLRTQLGGGTNITQALVEASQRIQEPRQTAVVLITDFYEGGSQQVLFDTIKSLKNSGVHFFPVGAMNSTGYFSVNEWFRTRLKELGTPILAGSPKKLIEQLKKVVVM